MCGRYSITTAPEAMRRLFKFTNDTPNLRPNYNCAPTQTLPVVRLNAESERELVTLKWGLIPIWTKDAKIAYSTINVGFVVVIELARRQKDGVTHNNDTLNNATKFATGAYVPPRRQSGGAPSAPPSPSS